MSWFHSWEILEIVSPGGCDFIFEQSSQMTRTFDALDDALTAIEFLETTDINDLKTETGLASINDLSFITFEDLKLALPSVAIIKLRKLEAVIKYLQDGQMVDEHTTAIGIQKHLVAVVKSTKTTPSLLSTTLSPTTSTIKTPLNCIPTFSGDPIEFEQWDISTRVTLGQMPHAYLLSREPVASGPNAASEQIQNKEFYNMLVNSCSAGSSYYLISPIKSDNGHKAWKEIQVYYNSEASVAMIVQHYQGQLK